MADCTFCKKGIPQGTGKMFVKADGKIMYFCSTKCEKNQLKLKRKARATRWTDEAHQVKAALKKSKEK